jgi:antirestriction protein ArdC
MTKTEEHRKEFVDKIFDLMQQGQMFWQRPWNVADIAPVNAVSGRAYRGCNIVYLLTSGMLQGYDDPRWLTYKQAQEKGWQVKKGSKGTRIEFWSSLQKADPDASATHDDTSGNGEEQSIRYCKLYHVFNAAQVDGIPPLEVEEPPIKNFIPHEKSERIMLNCGVMFQYGGGAAFYRPSEDKIYMPERDRFYDEAHFYSTALHEIAHSTGHPSRLNRNLKGDRRSSEYAREELRAEMASAFMQMDLGFSLTEEGMKEHTEQHAAYVQSWLEHLKKDYREFYQATHDAVKIADYVLAYGKEPAHEPKQEPGTADKAASAAFDCGAVARAAFMPVSRRRLSERAYSRFHS